MTLGLATCDEKGIYVAIESEGLPIVRSGAPNAVLNSILDSKIINIQRDPDYVLLVAGGLEHWCYVTERYKNCDSLPVAAQKIMELMDRPECMTDENRAFGLLCGYDKSGQPMCYRISRDRAKCAKCCCEEIFKEIQPIGKYDKEAVKCAKDAIGAGTDRLAALVQAIESLMDGSRKGIRAPIHAKVLPKD
jgi:hypothetical protein